MDSCKKYLNTFLGNEFLFKWLNFHNTREYFNYWFFKINCFLYSKCIVLTTFKVLNDIYFVITNKFVSGFTHEFCGIV